MPLDDGTWRFLALRRGTKGSGLCQECPAGPLLGGYAPGMPDSVELPVGVPGLRASRCISKAITQSAASSEGALNGGGAEKCGLASRAR